MFRFVRGKLGLVVQVSAISIFYFLLNVILAALGRRKINPTGFVNQKDGKCVFIKLAFIAFTETRIKRIYA